MLNERMLQALDPRKTIDLYQSVYVYIEDDLYYPIEKVERDKDGNYIIVCRNIKRDKPE